MECQNCGREVEDEGDLEVCAGDHEEIEEEIPMFLHADCPCPEHGWNGDREPYSPDQSNLG